MPQACPQHIRVLWKVFQKTSSSKRRDKVNAGRSLSQFQISVIPACPESFRKSSRRVLFVRTQADSQGRTGMTPKNKHPINGRPAAFAAEPCCAFSNMYKLTPGMRSMQSELNVSLVIWIMR